MGGECYTPTIPSRAEIAAAFTEALAELGADQTKNPARQVMARCARHLSTMTNITCTTCAEIEAKLAATMAEVMRKQREWFEEWPTTYERMMKASIEEFVANFERRRAEFWAQWKPPKAGR